MKRYVLLGAALAVIGGAGVAVAQAPAPPPGPPGAEGPHPGMERGGHRMGPGHGMRMMMQASKAAHFHLVRGDSVVDIKCAADEPMKACVDAAAQLLDKLAGQPK